MNNEQKGIITTPEQIDELRAIDLFERRNELTDDELDELAASPAMQDAMLDLLDMESAFYEEPVIEHPIAKRKTIAIKLSWFKHVAAACVLLLVGFFAWKYVNTPGNVATSPVVQKRAMTADGIVFEQQDNSCGVTLACAEGASVSPALQSVGNSVIADFTALQSTEAQEVRMDVPVGYDATVTLSDGTVAYLHPGSRLKFPTLFTGSTRQVILEGECYFKVAHDATHPFIVSANGILTTVLGTEFNVTTNSNNGTVVTLINGSVRVNDSNSDAELTITPGQQVCLQHNKFVAKNVNTSVFEAWRDGFICYDNMPMSEVMEAIGRNYNMTVQFNNYEVMQTPIRFVCERKATIDEAIALINSLKKVVVARRNGMIVVE